MGSDPEIVHDAVTRVLEQARRWPGVDVVTDVDVVQVVLERGVLARIHPDGRVEIPFPRPVGEALVTAGKVERHQALPDSGWVETRLAGPGDEARVVELLELALEARRGPGRGERQEKRLDRSLDQTFPASDPPASNRE